jgi:acyl-CoA reductase-like NAD-dependent aldehyde dehydrogenase
MSLPELPILRWGRPYRSVQLQDVCDHRTGEPLARMSLANSGLIAADLQRQRAVWSTLQRLEHDEAIALCERACALFRDGTLALGEGAEQDPAAFLRQQSATTAMPEALCRANMEKICFMFSHMRAVLAGLAAQPDLGADHFRMRGTGLCFAPRGHALGVVLPNNSPGVHALWLPALALRIPLALKPGSQEPWTPWRVAQSLLAAGYPAEAFGFYPTDHGGGNQLLLRAERGMVFGDSGTTARWAETGRVEVHGPGLSKVLLDEEAAADIENRAPGIVASIAANGGRSCVNASGVWTAAHGRAVADALARCLAAIRPRPMADPEAGLCGFANPAMAAAIDAQVEAGLRIPGAEDVTARYRQGDRLVRLDGTTFLQPTLIRCDSADHPLANREFLFPYAAVVECPTRDMPARIGPSLVVTAMLSDAETIRALHFAVDIPRLNVGPVATCAIDWTQPHEGNLFEHLFRRRVVQVDA